ncbi:hypothetical protein SUBVAR_06108 [Subdoligranulum variabile DSM 15176]|uniref:Uncharacterized protein n=1 Tax=Subdoligranulum variabile DSM 15176 TaxID=411471 RepID=D1PNZ4_9FIRM|nr:hypothetical protein SUBVAR_06108 [Subdoligranulum variabile DSM 15176]
MISPFKNTKAWFYCTSLPKSLQVGTEAVVVLAKRIDSAVF